MHKYFELILFVLSVVAMGIVIAIPGDSGNPKAQAEFDRQNSESPTGPQGAGAQYIVVLAVTLIAVGIWNWRKGFPSVNRWRAAMLTAFIWMVVNLVVFFSMGLPKLLGADRFCAFVGQMTGMGWIVLLGSWIASWRYKRRHLVNEV